MQKIIGQIFKDVLDKEFYWPCIIDDCKSQAINSHFLQKNGILSLLTENGHLIETKLPDSYYFQKSIPQLEFKKTGVKQAISVKLFCKKHDDKIFKFIEKNDYEFKSYQSFLLFSYRVTCGELRKKEIYHEIYLRIYEDETLENINNEFLLGYINGFYLGLINLQKLKLIFEKEISAKENTFEFKAYLYPRIDIYASALFSPMDDELNIDSTQEELENIFIHIIPREDETILLVGYHKEFSNLWTKNYVESWGNLSQENFEIKISELLMTRIENWGMSQKLYCSIPKQNIEKFREYSLKNIMNLVIDPKLQFNFFKENRHS